MRLLRKAIDMIELSDKGLEEFDGLFPDPLTEHEQNLIGNFKDLLLGRMYELVSKGRTHLLLCGLEIPLEHPLAVEIIACPKCYRALGDTVEHDMLPGEFEDAGMECCIAHTHPVVQYGRAQHRKEFCPQDCDKKDMVCLPDLCDHWNEDHCGGINWVPDPEGGAGGHYKGDGPELRPEMDDALAGMPED